MTIIRIGEGRSSSGKILDKDTKWFTSPSEAMKYAIGTKKRIYISKNNSKYIEIDLDTLELL